MPGLAAVHVALGVSTAACGGATGLPTTTDGNPLVGTWRETPSGGTAGFFATVDLESTGKVSGVIRLSAAEGASCAGSVEYTDASWTSTSTTITFSDLASCSGSIVCGQMLALDCSELSHDANTCTYALGDSDDTLVLTDCSSDAPGSPAVGYSRVN